MGFIALLSFWMYAAVNDISKSVQTTGPTAMEVIVDQTNSRV